MSLDEKPVLQATWIYAYSIVNSTANIIVKSTVYIIVQSTQYITVLQDSVQYIVEEVGRLVFLKE